MAKTKELISFAVTAKLICIFVFAYGKIRFSHDAAQMDHVQIRESTVFHSSPLSLLYFNKFIQVIANDKTNYFTNHIHVCLTCYCITPLETGINNDLFTALSWLPVPLVEQVTGS